MALLLIAVLGCGSDDGGNSNTTAGSGVGGAGGAGGAGGGPVGGAGGTGGQDPGVHGRPTLFFIDGLGRVLRADTGGSEPSVIASGQGIGIDGVAVDVAAGHVYWTNMGVASADDGTITRSDLDGGNAVTIVPAGGTFTPKQLTLDPAGGKLYWSDREGMRVMRANLDGSAIETLVTTGSGDTDRAEQDRHCVGIAIDVLGGHVYWTQKGGDNAGVGTIKRAGLELPAGEDPAQRSDIETLFAKLPEPINLDLDLKNGMIYWTDRGDNTVSRAPMDPPAGVDPASRTDREILVHGLGEAIGVALDVPRGVMFYTSLTGVVGKASLDGANAEQLLTGQGALTGIALVNLPEQ